MSNNSPPLIVVLDDDPRMVGMLCELLTDEGYRVQGTTTFEQAKTILRSERVDLVITDLCMPGIDGANGMKTLYAQGLIEKVLVVSGYVDSTSVSILSAMRCVVGIVHKPFHIPDLIKQVANGIAGPVSSESVDL